MKIFLFFLVNEFWVPIVTLLDNFDRKWSWFQSKMVQIPLNRYNKLTLTQRFPFMRSNFQLVTPGRCHTKGASFKGGNDCTFWKLLFGRELRSIRGPRIHFVYCLPILEIFLNFLAFYSIFRHQFTFEMLKYVNVLGLIEICSFRGIFHKNQKSVCFKLQVDS